MDKLAKYQSKSITRVDKYVCTLSDELKKLAKNELRETEAVRNNAIMALRDWTMSNPRIIKGRLDSAWLLRFLRFKKFSIPMAQEAIERYLVMRESNIGKIWFDDLNILRPSAEKLFDSGFICVLPNRDKFGRRVVFHRPGVISAHSPTDFHDSLTLVTSTFETLLQDEENQIRGIVHVSDVLGLSLQHLTMCTPQYYFRIGKNTEKALAMRQKAFHILNMHKSVKFISKIIVSHMNPKLKSRTHFYSKFKDFKAIDKDNLPFEYGGEVPLMDLVRDWKKELMQYQELRLKYNEMKVAIDMYPPPVIEGSVKALKIPLCCPELYDKPKKNIKEYGIQGSFRKLEFD